MAPELADPTHLQSRHLSLELTHGLAREADCHQRSRPFSRVLRRPLEFRNAFGAAFEFDEQPLAVRNRCEGCRERGDSLSGPPFALPMPHVQPPQFIERLCADFPGEAARPFGIAIMD